MSGGCLRPGGWTITSPARLTRRIPQDSRVVTATALPVLSLWTATTGATCLPGQTAAVPGEASARGNRSQSFANHMLTPLRTWSSRPRRTYSAQQPQGPPIDAATWHGPGKPDTRDRR